MFGKMKDIMGQWQRVQELMKNEHFKAFIAHPKVQELFRDPDFKEIAQTKDFSKILNHPKFAALMRDPELASLVAKINPKSFMGQE